LLVFWVSFPIFFTPICGFVRVNKMSESYLSETDESLMKKYLTGDGGAFDVVYRRRREGLRRFFERQCGSRAVSQELAQDVWFKLIRACQGGQYTAEAKFTTYLYRLAKNQLIDWYRKNGNIRTVELYDTMEREEETVAELHQYHVEDPERILADKEKADQLRDGINGLSEEQRTTLLMQLEGDMSYEEIAEAMGTNRETVKTRLRYARDHLKRRVLA